MRAWEKCKGAAQAELCTTLAFLVWVGPMGSPHTFAALFCGFDHFGCTLSGLARGYFT